MPDPVAFMNVREEACTPATRSGLAIPPGEALWGSQRILGRATLCRASTALFSPLKTSFLFASVTLCVEALWYLARFPARLRLPGTFFWVLDLTAWNHGNRGLRGSAPDCLLLLSDHSTLRVRAVSAPRGIVFAGIQIVLSQRIAGGHWTPTCPLKKYDATGDT